MPCSRHTWSHQRALFRTARANSTPTTRECHRGKVRSTAPPNVRRKWSTHTGEGDQPSRGGSPESPGKHPIAGQTAFVHTVVDDHSRSPTPRSATTRKPPPPSTCSARGCLVRHPWRHRRTGAVRHRLGIQVLDWHEARVETWHHREENPAVQAADSLRGLTGALAGRSLFGVTCGLAVPGPQAMTARALVGRCGVVGVGVVELVGHCVASSSGDHPAVYRHGDHECDDQ